MNSCFLLFLVLENACWLFGLLSDKGEVSEEEEGAIGVTGCVDNELICVCFRGEAIGKGSEEDDEAVAEVEVVACELELGVSWSFEENFRKLLTEKFEFASIKLMIGWQVEAWVDNEMICEVIFVSGSAWGEAIEWDAGLDWTFGLALCFVTNDSDVISLQIKNLIIQ